jgi:hypothetical protein
MRSAAVSIRTGVLAIVRLVGLTVDINAGRPEGKLRDVSCIDLAGETTILGLVEARLRSVAEVSGATEEEQDGRGDVQGQVGFRTQMCGLAAQRALAQPLLTLQAVVAMPLRHLPAQYLPYDIE